MRVLITGGTGFVGTRLRELLEQAGHESRLVSRGPQGDYDWSDERLARGVDECDAVVHLAGENLFAKRWSDAQKQKLWASRVETTKRLAALLAAKGGKPFVSTSAIGYYGASETAEMDESSPRGDDFLARLCTDWEDATEAATEAGVRTCVVRTGVVLGKGGGALAKMLPPFKLGAGGPLGNGRQWVSWVHLDDLCRLYLYLLEDGSVRGRFNATAPQPVRMKELASTLGKVLHRPSLFPVPGAILRLALGDVADVLLTGQYVLPRRALEAGFEFAHPDLEGALRHLLGKESVAV
jgi:uncharacterized protein (TIGR01777 family)